MRCQWQSVGGGAAFSRIPRRRRPPLRARARAIPEGSPAGALAIPVSSKRAGYSRGGFAGRRRTGHRSFTEVRATRRAVSRRLGGARCSARPAAQSDTISRAYRRRRVVGGRVARSPRRSSSCSLVSSLQSRLRARRPEARSASAAASRGPLSNAPSRRVRASSPMRARRAVLAAEIPRRRPAVGSPGRHAISATGPGAG